MCFCKSTGHRIHIQIRIRIRMRIRILPSFITEKNVLTFIQSSASLHYIFLVGIKDTVMLHTWLKWKWIRIRMHHHYDEPTRSGFPTLSQVSQHLWRRLKVRKMQQYRYEDQKYWTRPFDKAPDQDQNFRYLAKPIKKILSVFLSNGCRKFFSGFLSMCEYADCLNIVCKQCCGDPVSF